MGLFSKDIETLDDLFEGTLQALYYAEHQIAEMLPELAEKATRPELRAAFEQHLAETEEQIRRLEQVFGLQDIEAEQGSSAAIDGILEFGEDLAGDIEDDVLLDAGLIAVAQLAVHHEIAQYGTLIAWARALGRDQSADLLALTLAEKKAAHEKLGALAEAVLQAEAGNDDEDEDKTADEGELA